MRLHAVCNIMDSMLNLFDTICRSDYQDVVLHTFLNACSDQQAFVNEASSTIQPIVSKINSKLNSSTSRFEGLLMLKTYLPQCSIDIFGENAMSWMQQCLKAGEVRQNSRYEVHNTAFQVLRMLLQMSEGLPEMKKPISSVIVPKIIENFEQINPHEVSLAVLECLEVLMHNYGSACGQQKNVVEKCLLQYVDCMESDVVNRAARCMACLPLLGGGGSYGASHIARWNQHQQKLCATLHGILDELFEDIKELPNSYSCGTSEKFALADIKESSPQMRVHRLIMRFTNISKCLQAVLTSEFPVEKRVLPESVLGVVCRGLAVNIRTLGKKISPDILMIRAMLPQVHIVHLQLLDSLVTCCRGNLLPYASIICRLVLQTLKWTSEEKWVYSMEKPYCQLREAACNSLKLWLQVSNSGSCVELVADQLIPLLIQDVWFEKESVTLIAQNIKKGNKMQQKDHVRNSRRHLPNKTANKNVCRAALQLLQWVLHSAAPFLKPAIHRLLQEKTVGLLLDIQRTSNPEDLPVPFSEALCRLELYQLLYALTLEPHAVWPPPTQFALCIFRAGRSDTDLKVSAFCTTSLAAVEKLIHPSSSTLQFPVPLEEMLESTKNYKQEYIVPASENSVVNVNTVETNDVIEEEKEEAQKDAKSSEVHVKEVPKQTAENINSDDVEIVYENQVDDSEEEEVEEEEEEEEDDDECMESDEIDSDLEEGMATDDDISVMSENLHLEEEGIARKLSVKRFREQPENGDTPCVVITESEGENEDMKNAPTSKGDKQNDVSRKQSASYINCRSDLQATNAAQMNRLPDTGQVSKLVKKVPEIPEKQHDVKSNNIADFEPPGVHPKYHDGNDEDEEIDEEDDIDDEDMDDIENVNEPNPKKRKLDSPTSVRETDECMENNVGDNEAYSVKDVEEIEEDPLKVNGIDEDSEEVSEEEMLKSFVDVLASEVNEK